MEPIIAIAIIGAMKNPVINGRKFHHSAILNGILRFAQNDMFNKLYSTFPYRFRDPFAISAASTSMETPATMIPISIFTNIIPAIV